MNTNLRAVLIGEFSWRRFIRSLILIPICVTFGLLVIAVFFSEWAIFQPQAASYKDTPDIIKLKTKGGDQVSARFQENPQATLTILLSHGNAEDIGVVEPYTWRLRDLGFNVLTYDYQGYGTSNGSPSEEKAYAAIDAAYEYLLTEKLIEPKRIILHGRSLGGAVAVDLAARKPVAGLILESTFTSAFRVVTRYPLLPFDKFESIKKIGSVSCPVLIIHGTDDWAVPIYHSERLFEAANEPKRSFWVEGAGHNNVERIDERAYADVIKSFAQTTSAQ
ncbi:MAG: alpha/beta hydrolase [Acidobacteriota bacterium]